jgi:hypothetical protein
MQGVVGVRHVPTYVVKVLTRKVRVLPLRAVMVVERPGVMRVERVPEVRTVAMFASGALVTVAVKVPVQELVKTTRGSGRHSVLPPSYLASGVG